MKSQIKNKRIYKNFIKTERHNYIEHSKKVEKRTSDYKDRINILDKTTGQIIKMEHNPQLEQKDSFLWFYNNNKKMSEDLKNQGFSSIFITLTLNTQFHKFIKKTGILNPKYNKDLSINDGYRELQNTFRKIKKDFKINRKYEKTYQSKVIEPHHDFTPHLHGIIYVKTEHVEKMLTNIENKISSNEYLGKSDIQVIKDIEKTTHYITKYIEKTQKTTDENFFHTLNGWKKMNKIRVYTSSFSFIPRYVFKRINNKLKLSKNIKNKNFIDETLEKCFIKVETEKSKKLTTIKKYGDENTSIYNVIVKRIRKIIDNNIDEEIKTELSINNEIFNRNGKTYSYRITDFVIIEKSSNKIIYDKNNFEIRINNYLGLDEYEEILQNNMKKRWKQEQKYLQDVLY